MRRAGFLPTLASAAWHPRRGALHQFACVGLLAAVGLVSTSCGEVARTGRAPVFIIIEQIQAASGAEPDTLSAVLRSDVQTLVSQQQNGQTVRVPTTFNDIGSATFRLALKNPGSPVFPTTPSTLNEVTLTRYRIRFQRADGRNTPGVDVPHGFDGALTVTIPATGTATAAFDVVRHQNKAEPPLSNMVGGGAANLISTIAEITFYGRDQAGNEISASGFLTVNFGDFGDPSS